MNYPPDSNQINTGADSENEASDGGNFALEEEKENDIIYSNNLETATKSKMTASSRLAFAVFVVLGFGTLLFGFISLANNIRGPFPNTPAVSETQNSNTQNQSASADEIVKLKNTDTDGDGLSDYDETYTYKTSPYLADTDSDSFSDKEEIDSKHDPLCPTGQVCNSFEAVASGTGSQTNETPAATQTETDPATTGTDTGSANLTEEEKAQIQQMTPAQLRELILQTGKISQTDLDKITDDQLMQMVAEMLK